MDTSDNGVKMNETLQGGYNEEVIRSLKANAMKLDLALKTMTSLSKEKCVYTLNDLSWQFGVSKQTIRGWCRKGFLSFSKIGQTLVFSGDDIEEFLKNNRYPAYDNL